MTTPSSRELSPNLRDMDMVLPSVMDTSSHDLIKDFFIPLLQNSCYYDRGVGYFSSGWLRISAIGLSSFAENGGRARWLTSPILSKNDWEALKEGVAAQQDTVLFEALRRNVYDLRESLEEKTLNALSWMVADEILEFRIAIPRFKLDGEFHDKFGIFQDADGNQVSFNGSYNDSIQGIRNYESIKIFTSWTQPGAEMVEQDQTRFNILWDNKDLNIRTITLDNAIRQDLVKLRKYDRPYKPNPLVPLRRLWSDTQVVETNKDPFIPRSVEPREYQQNAVQKWKENGNCGLFEMATGTGKTYAALFALIDLLQDQESLFSIIIAPTLNLVNQWEQEVRSFNFAHLLKATGSNPRWENVFRQYISSFRLGNLKFPVIITTYDTYKSDRFQELIKQIPENSFLIADECHYLGAAEMREKLPWGISYRLGLSATPHRHFDDEGTSTLLSFLKAEAEPTYKIDLGWAISNDFLCEYKLYPHTVELNEEELDEYVSISGQIARRIAINKQSKITSSFPEYDSYTELLLIKRKRIINQAQNKLHVVGEIFDSIGDSYSVHHTLVYCSEGRKHEDSEIDRYGRYLAFDKNLKIHKFTGDTPEHERDLLLRLFDEGDIQCLLAMKCLDEGIDVKRTETAIFVASSTNPRQYIQRRGRVLRTHPEKPIAVLHDILVVPTLSAFNEDEVIRLERRMLIQELHRFSEFASEALNYSECCIFLDEMCNTYEVEL